MFIVYLALFIFVVSIVVLAVAYGTAISELIVLNEDSEIVASVLPYIKGSSFFGVILIFLTLCLVVVWLYFEFFATRKMEINIVKNFESINKKTDEEG